MTDRKIYKDDILSKYMGTEKKRLQILNELRKAFYEAEKKDEGIKESVILSEICMNYGVTKRKAQEYVQVLIDAGFIERENMSGWEGLYLGDKYKGQEKPEAFDIDKIKIKKE